MTWINIPGRPDLRFGGDGLLSGPRRWHRMGMVRCGELIYLFFGKFERFERFGYFATRSCDFRCVGLGTKECHEFDF